jgi:hypothetical protein
MRLRERARATYTEPAQPAELEPEAGLVRIGLARLNDADLDAVT